MCLSDLQCDFALLISVLISFANEEIFIVQQFGPISGLQARKTARDNERLIRAPNVIAARSPVSHSLSPSVTKWSSRRTSRDAFRSAPRSIFKDQLLSSYATRRRLIVSSTRERELPIALHASGRETFGVRGRLSSAFTCTCLANWQTRQLQSTWQEEKMLATLHYFHSHTRSRS